MELHANKVGLPGGRTHRRVDRAVRIEMDRQRKCQAMTLLHDVNFGLRMMAKSRVVNPDAVLSIPDFLDLVEAGRGLESSKACDMELANLTGFDALKPFGSMSVILI